ncbi:MAG TPA: hypothetical protein VN688_28365 [Gemmataceae bacterium]|nr:hypothetical protein [Gemmataceae bacterium]
MPQIIVCPDCDRKLRVPDDLLGKKVRCPGCSVMFKAAAVGAGGGEIEDPIKEPAPRRKAAARDERVSDSPRSPRRSADSDEDDRPSSRSSRRRDEDDDYETRGPSLHDQKAGWNKVRIGINLVMIGTWVWLAGLVLGGLGGLLGVVLLGGMFVADSPQAGLTSLGFAGILLVLSIGIYYLGIFGELVLRLIGYGLAMAVPPRRNTGLKPLAITAFSLAAAHVVFSIMNFAMSGFSGFASSMSGRSGMSSVGAGLGLISGLCGFASFVVYLFFLRSVCNNARARDLAGSPITVLITFVSFYVVSVVIVGILICAGGMAIASTVQSRSPNAANSMGAWAIIFIVVLCILGLVYVALHVWYVMVLQKIRDAVASYRRGL